MPDYEGTYLVAWTQVRVDGLGGLPVSALETGASFAWTGPALRIDGGTSDLLVSGTLARDFGARASQAVRQLLGPALPPVRPQSGCAFAGPELGRSITLGLGDDRFEATLIEVAAAARPLFLFAGRLPPQGTLLTVVRGLYPAAPARAVRPDAAGVICFTPGTLLATPAGPRPVETLREGDRIDTADSGAQEIVWIGRRRFSAAGLAAMPEACPVRIRAGALGEASGDLLVSPRHRLLLKGDRARAGFGDAEVLVAAEDLVDGRGIVRDRPEDALTYIHVMLPRHHVVRANGVETESFHPASTDLGSIEPAELTRLAEIVPAVAEDPGSYGAPVRRLVGRAEAARRAAAAPGPH